MFKDAGRVGWKFIPRLPRNSIFATATGFGSSQKEIAYECGRVSSLELDGT
jgi:hypothetical protein